MKLQHKAEKIELSYTFKQNKILKLGYYLKLHIRPIRVFFFWILNVSTYFLNVSDLLSLNLPSLLYHVIVNLVTEYSL